MLGLAAGPGELDPAERNGEEIGKGGLCSRVAVVGDNGEVIVGLDELDILGLGKVERCALPNPTPVRNGSISGPAAPPGFGATTTTPCTLHKYSTRPFRMQKISEFENINKCKTTIINL